MINLTMSEVVDAKEDFAALLKLRLPVRTAYAVAKLNALLDAELASFVALRLKIYRELGSEDAEAIRVPPERMQEFRQRWSELLALPVEIACEPVPVSLDALDGQSVPASVFVTCAKCVRFENANPPA